MSPPNKTAYLSKSLYMRGLQCHKSLYLYSLHRIDAEGEEPKHFEYLAHPGWFLFPEILPAGPGAGDDLRRDGDQRRGDGFIGASSGCWRRCGGWRGRGKG
jgi:hypothetical protein